MVLTCSFDSVQALVELLAGISHHLGNVKVEGNRIAVGDEHIAHDS